MKNNFIKYTCALALVLSSSGALADSGVESVAGPSVKDSSDSANSSNSAGQLMSYLTAAKLATESAQHFSACPPHNPGQCALGALKAVMAALSMMQGGAHGNTASGASYSAGLTDGSNAYTPGINDPYAQETQSAYNAAKDALAKLQKGVAGSTVDLKTGKVKTADGKEYDIKKLSTPEGMAAAGIPQGAIDGAMEYGAKVAKEAQDKVDKMKLGAMTTAGGFDEGGGGGGRSGASGSSEESTAGYGVAGGLNEREPANMAGMQKNYNGEPIGVAADSIFLMMNRRYKVKESQDSFFSDADIALQK